MSRFNNDMNVVCKRVSLSTDKLFDTAHQDEIDGFLIVAWSCNNHKENQPVTAGQYERNSRELQTGPPLHVRRHHPTHVCTHLYMNRK
jgi:hypothetical protein